MERQRATDRLAPWIRTALHAARARLASTRIWWADVASAAVLLLFGVMGTGPATTEEAWAGSQVVTNLLVIAACVPIALWRWRPLWTFGATGLAVMIYLGLGTPFGPILVAGLVAVYGVASRSTVRQVVAAFAGLLVAAVVAGVARELGGGSWVDVASFVVVLAAPAAVGMAVRVRHQAEEDVRSERAERQVMHERLRMAQEVHDVVGHGLTLISMQAGAALHVLDRHPARARQALEAIRAISKESLEGLRTELDAMRRYDAQPAPRRPAAGPADLRTLVERVRDSGLNVRLEGDAVSADLPPAVETAIYRIVQEALTNVLRHAGPSVAVTVRLQQAPDAVLLDVIDTGPGTNDDAPEGRGIRGMRARAEALGGELQAGPGQTGGFVIHGRIPTVDVTS